MAGGYSHDPKGLEALVAQLRSAQTQIDNVWKGIKGLGIRIDGATGDLVFDTDTGVLRIEGPGGEVISGGGGLNIADDGTLTVDGDASFGGTLDVTGDATFGGNLDVAGTLSLPNGIIDNDALTSPLQPAAGSDFGSGYTLSTGTTSTGGTVRASVTLAVPSGYTRALIQAIVNDGAVNSTASDDYLTSFVQIVSAGPVQYNFSSSATTPPGTVGFAAGNTVNLITGLSGGSVVVNSRPFGFNSAWAANAVNSTYLSVFCLFLR